MTQALQKPVCVCDMNVPDLQNVAAQLLDSSINELIKNHRSAQAIDQHHVSDHNWMVRCVAYQLMNHKYLKPVFQRSIFYENFIYFAMDHFRFALTYRLTACKISCLSQWYIGSFIWKRCRKYFASSDINANTVNNWPINFTAKYCIQFTDTGLCQIDFHRMLVKWFCVKVKKKIGNRTKRRIRIFGPGCIAFHVVDTIFISLAPKFHRCVPVTLAQLNASIRF